MSFKNKCVFSFFLNVNRVLAFLCAHPDVRCAPSNWGGGAVLKSGGGTVKKFLALRAGLLVLLHFQIASGASDCATVKN